MDDKIDMLTKCGTWVLEPYLKVEKQSVVSGNIQSKLAQGVKLPDTKPTCVHRDSDRYQASISMTHMSALTPYMLYSVWQHLIADIEAKMMSLGHF